MARLSVTVFILTILLNLTSGKESTSPTITLTLKRNGYKRYTFNHIGTSILLENQPVTIKISSPDPLLKLKCSSSLDETVFFEGNLNRICDSECYEAQIDKAVPEMAGYWKCLVQISKKEYVSCEFLVDFRSQDTPSNQDASDEDTPSNQDPSKAGKGNANEVVLLIIGILVGVIITSLALCIIITIYKRRQTTEKTNSTVIFYKNLPEHNNGPMPIPQQSQCQDELAYTSPKAVNIEATNTKPIPKQLKPRNVSETESEVQYSEPNLTPDNQYPKVVPKETGNANSIENFAIDYADLEFTTQSRNNKNFPKNDSYAVVMPIKSASNRDDKYENVFDDQRYENVRSQKDSIEPAYCEIEK